MKMTCLVVDDEPLAVELMQKHIQELGTLTLVGTCRNATEAMAFLHQQHLQHFLTHSSLCERIF
ncbi:MAG: response regulator [Cytophagia bacterium]|nr:response regulator [Cytophagia bacterium]